MEILELIRGLKVRCVSKSWNVGKNRTGKVVSITPLSIGIEWDEKVKEGHDCMGYGKNGYCCYMEAKNLQVI